MTRPTREEAQTRIAKDTGKQDDIVWTSQNFRRTNCYHDNKDCEYHYAEHVKPRTRKDAQADYQPPCKACVLDEMEKDEMHTGGKAILERLIEQGKVDV